MLVIHGHLLYGKVDHVPGLFYVATEFLHLYWIPIFPGRSYLVLEGTRENRAPRRIRISMSGRSLLFAWGRLALILGGCVIFPSVLVSDLPSLPANIQAPAIFAAIAFPLASLALFALSYRLGRARPERALALASQAGIAPEVLAQHLADRLTSEDEDRLRDLAAEQTHSQQDST
jgi:hypothetical protein